MTLTHSLNLLTHEPAARLAALPIYPCSDKSASLGKTASHLQLVRGPGASKRGVFLRAETTHGHFSYLETIGPSSLHERSHGEAFIDFLSTRSGISGLWILDEPESALSFSGCLTLIALLRQLSAQGSQIVLSTHSPILEALPGAEVFEVGPWGLRESSYDDLDLAENWRLFLQAPERILRHLD